MRSCGGFPITTDEIIAATRRWLERSVIGLNLCPFAESVYRGDRVRFRVSEQRSASALLDDLRSELRELQAADPLRWETTLLIHPWVLTDFIEYNDFLDVCEHLLREASIERAIAAVPDTSEIYRRNIRTLRDLGHAGWQRLWRD